jgi:ankyrin repeat protein
MIVLNLAEQIEAMDPGHGKAFEQRESHHHGQIMQHLTEDHRRCLQAFKTSTYEKFKNINPNRVERTCEWVLNSSQYLRWWNTTGNDLLWISADPGCGKSVLAKFLIDEVFGISDSDVLVIYFFFKDNEEQNNLATALCAVLHRLFSLRPQLLQHALPFWERSKEKIQYELDDMWRILIAATSDPICGNTVCVFDALDECYNWDQKQLIERLREFHVQRPASQYNWLKFLVTSRPYYDIQDLFQPVTKSFPQIHLRGEEENDQIRKEISLVVKTRMAELREKLNLNTRLHERLEKELLNMKHRTYLWLYLAIGDIESTLKNSFRPDRESIPLIPRNVTEAYNKILDRINPEQEATVKRLLQIIVGARRPLTIWEMAMALGIATSQGTRLAREAGIQPDGLAEKIRQLCGLFVYISNSRIYLIHQTAREFLIRNYNGSIWHLDLVETENEMSQICVKYLLMDDLVSHDGESARSLLRYSSQYWADHFRHIPSPRKDLLQSVYKLYDLSNERFTLWFPIFWELVMLHEERPTMNAIHLAAFNGHQNVLSRLDMSSNGGIDQADSSKTNSLHWACLRGNVEVVQLLLGKGADVNARGGKYGSALQAASQEGHLEIAQLLLEKGADVNTQGGYYGNALQAASHRRHLEIAQLLLEKGADVNTQGGDYGSALQAASQEGHLDIAQLLLEKGADVNTQGGNYGSALQAASQEGHLEIAQLLLEKGADVNTQGGDYGNALQAASAEGHLEIAQLLLEEGADVNTQGGDYGSALQAASAEGHLEIAQLLLGRGANINVGSNIQSNDKRGRTPLSWAAGRGDEGVVRMLLAKDVNPDSEDYSGRTPISYALEKGHQSIVNLLYMESRRRRERQSDFIFAADVEASSNADLKDRTHDAETVKKQVHTDSGYATQHATTLNTTFDVVENPEDAGTVYSDESSLASKEDSYMTDLAHDLYSKVSSEELDENCIKRILAILPELLKDFALRIGHNAHSRKHSDIMVFVRKHRRYLFPLHNYLKFEVLQYLEA